MIYTPKADLKLTEISKFENINLITSCDDGQVITHKPKISLEADRAFKFKLGNVYIVDTIEAEVIQKLSETNDTSHYTDFNKISRPGYYLIRLKEDLQLSKQCIPQLSFKDIVEFGTKNKYCSDGLPWNNTLTKIIQGEFYLINVTAVYGVKAEAGQELKGVILNSDLDGAIQGIILKPGEQSINISFDSSNPNTRFKVYAIGNETRNPITMLNNTVEIEGDKFFISFGIEYVGKVFTIKSGRVENRYYKGLLNTGNITLDTIDDSKPSIIFKPKDINDLYDMRTMFVYCRDRLFHINFDKNYISEDFLIVYDGFIYRGAFTSKSSIDTPIILRREQ